MTSLFTSTLRAGSSTSRAVSPPRVVVRILHVCQPTDGGTAVVVRDLVRAGVAAGDDVTVACPADGYLADWAISAGANWIELPMGRAPALQDLQMCREVRPMMAAADIVHLHSSKAGAIGRLAAVSLRSGRPRIVFTPHGWSWHVGTGVGRAYRTFERLAAHVTDVVTVVSTAEMRAGREVLGVNPRIDLIENGVDSGLFCPDGPRAEHGSGRLLVQVGRLSVQKGQDRSIRALAALPNQTVRLRLIGDGPQQAVLQALAQELGVADRVEFVGSVDPRPHLRAADVVLLPSRWEGMSLVLLEAMSIGAAIVASDCAGSDALAGIGLLIDHANDDSAVRGLVDHVSRLLSDDAERQEIGAAARDRVEHDFILDTVLGKYVQLWHGRESVLA